MKEIIKILAVAIFFISIVFPDEDLFAQKREIKFERFSLEEGLSVSAIVSLVQDSKGFLWIATEDGLNRYDGYNFKIFRNIPDDSTSLCNNRTWSIIEDSQGILWIGTNGGLEKFDYEKEQFIHYKNNANDSKSLIDNTVSAICEDKSVFLWIRTLGGGLSRFDKQNEQFTNYRHDPYDSKSLSNNEVISIYADKSNVLWIGTSDGLNKFDRRKGQFTHYTYNPNDPSRLSNNNIRSIYEDKAGVLWIGPWGISYASNLTPDNATGIGALSEEIFIKTLREGKLKGVGRPLLPPMPWQVYGMKTDQDLKAIYAFLQSLKPIRNEVPQPVMPDKMEELFANK